MGALRLDEVAAKALKSCCAATGETQLKVAGKAIRLYQQVLEGQAFSVPRTVLEFPVFDGNNFEARVKEVSWAKRHGLFDRQEASAVLGGKDLSRLLKGFESKGIFRGTTYPSRYYYSAAGIWDAAYYLFRVKKVYAPLEFYRVLLRIHECFEIEKAWKIMKEEL